MAHPGGRPPEYKATYVKKVDEYLKLRVDKVVRMLTKEVGKQKFFERKIKVQLPTIEDFAVFLGVSKVSLYTWEKENPEFLNALDKIRAEQQRRLLQSGLSGDYNSTIAKLVLSANHGMREKSDLTTNDKEFPQPLLNAIRNHNGNGEDKPAPEEN